MKRRKPWLAALLSLVCPGLGQMYNGDIRLAGVSLVIGSALSFYSVNYLFDSMQKLMTAILIGLFVDIIFSVHAYYQAKRLGDMELKPFQRWWCYLLGLVVLYGLPDGYGQIIPTRIMSFKIPSESMLPTLLVGDRLVADGWAFWGKNPKHGDVIVFDYPKDPSVKYVKRVIGVPGDVIELREGELSLNGKIVSQSRTSRPNVMESGWESTEFLEKIDGVEHSIYRVQPMTNTNFGPVTVPADEYFVMGDNRDRSNDSRFWGFVPRKNILAQMRYIYFSWDSKDSRFRSERLGVQIH